MKRISLFSILTIAIFYSCSDSNHIEDPQQNIDEIKKTIVVNTNTSSLNTKIQYKDQLISIKDIPSQSTKSTKKDFEIDLSKNYTFTLKAEVNSPKNGDKFLQATHVKIYKNKAYVTYNTKGDEYHGGIYQFDISKPEQPILQASYQMKYIDLSSIDIFNDKVYVAGAIDPKSPGYVYNSPAIIMEFVNDPSGSILALSKSYNIPSHVATDVYVDENYVYVSSGAKGGLTVLNHNFDLIKQIDIADARSLVKKDNQIYVLNGNKAQIESFSIANFSASSTIQLTSPVTAQSKTEFCMNDHYIFAALNESGLDIRKINGEIKEHFNCPKAPNNALKKDYVTNSVSINKDLLLIGNGGAGLYVGAMIPTNNDKVQLLGKMGFDASANYVESKDNLIFVASGTGGLKIISVKEDNGVPPHVIPTKPCQTLKDNIITMFPESSNNMAKHPDLFSDNNNLILRLIKESPVYLTFIDEGASYKNSLAYYTYDYNNPPRDASELELHMLFPNASKKGHGGGLTSGDRVQLGNKKFPINTVIGFCMIVKGWKNGETVDGVYRHYTDIQFNDNNNQQHILFLENECKDLVLSFEDIKLPNGDKDFNDIIFTVTDNEKNNLVTTAFDLKNIIKKISK